MVDFAGTDAPYAAGTAPADPFLYFPTVVAPITVSYNVSGLTGLKLSADTIAKIFQGTITTWDDAAIKADNPKAKLPSTSITVVHRSDGSGTTQNFTNFFVKARRRLDARNRLDRAVAGEHARRERQRWGRPVGQGD